MTDTTWTYQTRVPPFRHQVLGVLRLVAQRAFFLCDEMGAGKTKQVIDAACLLCITSRLSRVLVVTPASVRSVWAHEELGELAKHLWDEVRARVTECHSRGHSAWTRGPKDGASLEWLVTNYEYFRARKDRQTRLIEWCEATSTLLVLDESSAVKNHTAAQTKACRRIRAACDRVVLLNGTPIANHVGDLYAQSAILDPTILGCKNYFHFRSRYAVMGGYLGKQVIAWRDVDDIQRRLAPYVLRRLKTDCIDLPLKLDPVTLNVTLTPSTWSAYRGMRDELVTWLDAQTASIAPHAAVKAMRLAQITSGFVGGVEDAPAEEEEPLLSPGNHETREVGREKLDLFLSWLTDRLEEQPRLKLLVWCRFRPEVRRLIAELPPSVRQGAIWGEQRRGDRQQALELLDPRTTPQDDPVVVVGTPRSGSVGLNLAAAWCVVYLSNDYSLMTRLQSEDRVHRPGQTRPVSYYDVVASGPKGQKTIDHAIIRALRTKQDLATMTTKAWVQLLLEE